MVLIAENLHIISKATKEAIIAKDDRYIIDIVKKAVDNDFKVFDLNVGPAKGSLAGALEYLVKLIEDKFDVEFSFDTSNFEEMQKGFQSVVKSAAANCFLNSVCADDAKAKAGFSIASEYNSNVIALTFNPENGISKSADERLELAVTIYEKAAEFGVAGDKIYFDPLVLPVSAAQEQANAVLDSIRMLKEALAGVHTIIGLSNISNGSPKEVRPLLNRVFLVLAMGAGLDSAIVDGLDSETIRIYNMIMKNSPLNSIDSLYYSLYNMVNEFKDISEVKFDKDNPLEVNIVKAAKILLNQEIYSHSFCLK